jgi:hypothetical protein
VSAIYVGMVFEGFCQGYFGRDAHGQKRVEAFGADWIVARSDRQLYFATFDSTDEMTRCIRRWRKEACPS